MTISLSDAGKRFNREWIFRHFNYTFESGQSYAITGPNGSGKSTLLQALGGSMLFSEGKAAYTVEDRNLDPENVYRYVSLCAPYMEVIEEMTLLEFLTFHAGFKPFIPGITIQEIMTIIGLEKAVHKQIRYYSSGMKQRVRLAQCIFSDTPLILLDEPCTNLDSEGIGLYQNLMATQTRDRLVIISSNDQTEYQFCGKRINIADHKS
jgi:ABC-type multidrug transport system ATPase subunit